MDILFISGILAKCGDWHDLYNLGVLVNSSGKAQDFDARVVNIGGIVFFSTETGDAWMLDPAEGLALCLARDGVEQDYVVLETESSFRIGWNAQYEIQDDAFTVATGNGRVRTIIGYPTEEIVRASRRVG